MWGSRLWLKTTSTMNPRSQPELLSPPRMISVVIPARNCGPTIDDQLRALAGQDYEGDWEVVVADNGSTDDTNSRVSEWQNRLTVRIVDARAHPGINVARNIGIAQSQGDFIAICDGDDVVCESWLRAMSRGAETGHLVGGPRHSAKLNAGLAQAWRGQQDPRRLPVALDFMPFIPGSNLGVWKAVAIRLGGFSEDFTGGGDDVDFCWRAQLAGFKLAFEPEAVVHYRHRDAIRAMARQFHGYAIAAAQLYKQYRKVGAPRQRRLRELRSYLWLLVHLPDLFRSDRKRGVWMRTAATRTGRLRGSLRYRTFFI